MREMMPPKIIMLIGFQASTKSSAAREIQANVPNAVILSRDAENGTIQDLIPKAEKYLLDGKVVILDNTNLTKAVRQPFIEIAKKLKVPIDGQYFKTTIEDCQIRHLRRMYDKFGQIYQTGKGRKDTHCFPPLVLFKARKDLEVPTKDEGFSKLIMRHVPPITWEESFNQRALFIDIDGTIRKTEHLENKYPVSPDEVELLYPAASMRAKLEGYRQQGYHLIGVSNQSGISKGVLTEEKVDEIFEKTRSLLGYTKDEFPILYCPHRAAPITCFCRKPQSGIAMDCIMKLKINPRVSIMVGDMKTDEEMANRLNIPYIDVNDFWKTE
jgi:D-glycero-D-manno-heptose 1,7-bisphosphate phosphatase